jgi:predicted O-linked N-acetylglucosamine transferase (SPINDLY family)
MSPLPCLDDVSPLWRSIAAAPTQAPSWLALARAYAGRDLRWQATYAARQAARLDPAQAPRLREIEVSRQPGLPADDAGLGRAVLPEARQLAARFAAALQACPGDWLTWLYVARLQEIAGESSFEAAWREARRLEPLVGESDHWMGVWRLNAGDASGAVATLSRLIEVRPVRCGSMMYLGEALLRTGRVPAAEKAFARASLSQSPRFLLLLAGRVHAANYWQEAIAILRKALSVQPDLVQGWLDLARIQSEVYALADCRDSLRRLQALDPANTEARLLAAGLKGRHGDAEGHLAMLRALYDEGADPCSRLASSIAMTSLYIDDLSPALLAARHRDLCAPIEAALAPCSGFAHAREPGRRLRIGFVTGDLHRQHPVNLFMLPVFERFDHARFEVCVYCTGGMHDEYTRRAQACTDRWLEVGSMDDRALRDAITADRIDVLIDLAGHTTNHRLGVFAMRAAPVQVTFLGYPHSTGLSTMDWIIGDPVVSPSADASLFSEGIAQMPHSVFCWAPVDDYPIAPARPADARVVFGSFNNAMKVSLATVALWADILRAVDGAMLLLKAPSLQDASVQERFAQLFAAHGIGRERLEFRGPTGLDLMMQEYGDLDVALDPLPYNGGTTSMQALWTGVPLVTLAGGNFASRMGASFLTTLGRRDWIAADRSAYLSVAAGLARDIGGLRKDRARLRARMASSPLCDIDAYVTDLQGLLQAMWAAHCEGGTQRALRAPSSRGASGRADIVVPAGCARE